MTATLKEIDALPLPEKIALVAAPLLIGASAWLDLVLPAEADKAWLLHLARMWLSGQKLYVDIVEVNPPLVVWLYALPVWISQHVPWVTDYGALGYFGLLCSALSMAVGTRLIARHPAFAGSALKQVEFALLLGLVFIFYTSQLYFFDRDHIFLVMAFPYMLRFMPSLAGEVFSLRLRLLVGCMAAVGFCIKPHTVIVFAALQLLVALRQRSLAALVNVENGVIAAASALYLLYALFCIPEYFQIIMPLAFATYAEFANHGEGWAYVPPIIVTLGLVFADFRPHYATPYRRDVYYFLLLCFAFIGYSLSNNGWGYTYNPMYCFTLFTTGWMLLEYEWLKRENETRGLPMSRVHFGRRGCIIVFVLHGALAIVYLCALGSSVSSIQASCTGSAGNAVGGECRRNSPFAQYVQDRHVRSFGTLSLDFGKWVTLLRLPGVRWETRFNHLWMLPRLIPHGEPAIKQYGWVLDYVGKSLAGDLNRRKPDIVFVDTSPGFMGMVRRFDYGMLLSRVPEFKTAWEHYRYDHTIDICGTAIYTIPSECRYDIYSRTP